MSNDASNTGAPARPSVLRSLAHRLIGDTDILPVEGRLPPFTGATGWLNSEPLTPQQLRGRVVLVDFWTYTCINWLRTLPYVRAWAEKYRDHGLVVIGAHTPEFGFERDLDNVIARSREFGVGYPIAVDSEYGVWSAFANHFWPAVYIADAQGRIRYHHFGEGEYAMTEMVIQQLLVEAGADGFDPDLVSVEPHGLRGAGRLANAPDTGDVPGPRQRHRLRIARRAAVQPAAHLPPTAPARPESVGAVRDMDARLACRGQRRSR